MRTTKKLNLLDLIELKFLQNLQDFFAKTMNVASITVDELGPITKPSNFSDFCINHTRKTKQGAKRCNSCDLKWGKIAAERCEPVIYQCHTGLTDFAVPIQINGQHLATILGGQILTEKPDEEKFRQIAKELEIDEDEYIAALRTIPILPAEKIQAAADFLFTVANSISAVSYANLNLAKFGLYYKKPRKFIVEDWFFSNCKKIDRPISGREFEVLKLIVLGKSNTEIAKELFISVHTAKKHVSAILEKLFVDDRVQLAVKAVREGLLDT